MGGIGLKLPAVRLQVLVDVQLQHTEYLELLLEFGGQFAQEAADLAH